MELDSWQSTLSSCKEKLSYILSTSALSDVVFIVGEERERIRAHTLILRLNSPVFDVMLSERWGKITTPVPPSVEIASSSTQQEIATKNGIDKTLDECPRCKHQSYIPRRFRDDSSHVEDMEQGEQNSCIVMENAINLPHLEPTSFRLFLKYIYTDAFDVPLEYALFVWHLAEFYNVPLLTEKCETFVMDSLDKENALMIYQHARTVHHIKIEEMAFQHVLFNARVIFASEDFINLTVGNLVNLLKEDLLDIEEASLFAGVYVWGEAECSRQELQPTPENIRRVLGDAFKLIRFPLIPAHRFTMDVVPKNLLSNDELISLYKYITLPSPGRESLTVDTCQFSKTPRRPVYHLSRYNPKQKLNPRLDDYGDDTSKFLFSIDNCISIVGVGIFASSPRNAVSETTNYEITIELRDDKADKVLSYIEKTIQPKTLKYAIVPVLFRQPVQLNKGSYTICHKIQGPLTYFNSGHCSKDLSVTSGNTCVTFKFSQVDDLIQPGIPIPELYFVF